MNVCCLIKVKPKTLETFAKSSSSSSAVAKYKQIAPGTSTQGGNDRIHGSIAYVGLFIRACFNAHLFSRLHVTDMHLFMAMAQTDQVAVPKLVGDDLENLARHAPEPNYMPSDQPQRAGRELDYRYD